MRLPGAILAVALAGAPALAEETSAEQVARAVEAHEEALSKLREQATSVLDELASSEEEAKALREAAAKAEADSRAAAARVAAAQKEENAAREGLVARLEELAPRLVARYELGKRQRMTVLMSATSMRDLLWRQRALDRVLASDLAILAQVRTEIDRLHLRRSRLESVKLDFAQRNQMAQEKRAHATRRQEELAGLHASLMEEQDLREKTLRELARVQTDLSRYVADLQHDDTPSRVSFARRRGKMKFPAEGPIEVGFGKVLNPKFNTVTFQKGIDIRAPEGSRVTAVAAGKLVHAGPFRGYGNLVIVDHGEGYHSLYAHLGTLSKGVGDEVSDGGELGTVGDTGSLKGPYLYFEIRDQGKPVDPKGWITAPR